MAYDEDLADRLRLLLGSHGVTEKRMFGGLAFLVSGRMAVAVSGAGGIMVRCEPAELEALSAEPDATTFQMQGRTMKGWLWVDGPSLDDDAVLRSWTERGVAYARSLPAK